MPEAPSKKSPRAPSISLKDALDRAIKAYDRERLHEAPTEVVAQNIGYKNANSGTSLSAIASMRYFGLLARPKNGFLAVTKDVETFRYAPSEIQRQALLLQFLTSPPLYDELLKKYATGLPSDATLKYELIQRGFIPAAAENALTAFKQSVEFARFFEAAPVALVADELDEDTAEEPEVLTEPAKPKTQAQRSQSDVTFDMPVETIVETIDKIPVRLPGGRRAWLMIPTPFFKADKARLKAHIDLLLAEDEET